MNKLISVLLGLIIFSAIACSKESREQKPSGKIDDGKIKKALEMRNVTSNSRLSRFFQNQMVGVANMQLSKKNGRQSMAAADTCDAANGWEDAFSTCAEYSKEIIDGFVVESWDYGDGCMDYDVLTKGKYTTKWKENEGSYYWEAIYENYAQTYSYYSYGNITDSIQLIEVNSTYITNGYYSTTFEEEDIDTSDGQFSVTYTSQENMTYQWDNEAYQSIGKSTMQYDQNSSTVLDGEYAYKLLTGDEEYTWKVLAPVVWNFECTDTWVAVRGIEHFTWNSDGESEQTTMNYGNGQCDNLVYITIDGVTESVDLSDYWFFCGTIGACYEE